MEAITTFGLKKSYGDKEAVKSLGVEAEVIKVQDIKSITNYGVLVTPALVVDGVVKVAGKVPKVEEIKEWIK